MAQAPAPPPADDAHADVPLAEHFIFGILGLGIVNGIFSPVLGIVFLLHPFWYPSIFLPLSAPFIMMLASLLTSTLTIMLAGIPAALYERCFNRGRTNEVSLWIWVSVLAVLSVPAVLRAINAL
jgi:hypothetical protein